MIPSNRLPQNPADYQSVPDDPTDWASMMQQWTKIRDSVPNEKKPDLAKSPQILKPVKSEVVKLPTSQQILELVKSEVVELPTSLQILKPAELEVVELPTSVQILNPVKSVVEAFSLSGTDYGEAFINVVAGVHCSNTSKEIQLPSKIRKSASEKKKKEHKTQKAERLTGLKSDELPKGPKRYRFSHAFDQQSQLINSPSEVSSLQKNLNGTSVIREKKDEIMEESMLIVRQILSQLLMEATENQVLIIAEEELKRAKSIAQSVRKKFSILSSLSGKFGLTIYDSDDSDNSEMQCNERNQLESDEELKILIDRRQQNFEKTEMQIDLEIESHKEEEKSIAYKNDMRKECIMKNDFERNKVDENRLLKSTAHHDTNNMKSKITNKIVPKTPDLTVDSCNKPKKQNHQTHCQLKSGTQFTIRTNGVSTNLKNIESVQENLSSSSSTLSPSSLSSTTSWSSGSRRSPRSSYYHYSRSDSDSNYDSRTRRKSKISRTNTRSSSSKTKSYSRHCTSPSKEYRRSVLSPRDRRLHSRFQTRRSFSRSGNGQKSSERASSRRYRCRSDFSESRS